MSGVSRSAIVAMTIVAAGGCGRSATAARPATPADRPASALSSLRHDLDAILNNPTLAHGYWGVLVKSLKTDETLYELNAHKLMIPASNMKIVTLAAAADRLGWSYTYETRLAAVGTIAGGTLNGDLVVIGSGDPSLMADGAPKVFGAWADALAQRGVRTIAGRIVGDDHAFDDETLGFGWSWDDLPDDYAAGVGALQWNESALRVTVAPGPAIGDSAAVSVAPAIGFQVDNLVRTTAAGSPTSISTRRLPGRSRLELRGTIAVGAAPRALDVSVDNPTQAFVDALRLALIGHGIDVRGPAVDIDDVPDPPSVARATAIASAKSPSLDTLAVRLMKISQNQYAETFLKTLGAAAGTPTFGGGRAVVQATLQPWGVAAEELIVRDGSGLSRYDYVTPAALTTILTHIDRDEKLRAPFLASLPVIGRDGTLGNRLKGTTAEGSVRAKTGSMSQVRSVSGYATTADNEPLVFSIIANNFDTGADVINAATDAILVRLTQFARR